jgi:hypothetical protein
MKAELVFLWLIWIISIAVALKNIHWGLRKANMPMAVANAIGLVVVSILFGIAIALH